MSTLLKLRNNFTCVLEFWQIAGGHTSSSPEYPCTIIVLGARTFYYVYELDS